MEKKRKLTFAELTVVVLFWAWLGYAVGIEHKPVKNTIWALSPAIIAMVHRKK